MEIAPEPRHRPVRGTARTPADALAWLGGTVLGLSSFMSWYTGPADGITVSVTGWHAGALGKLVFFLGLAVVVALSLRSFGVELPTSVPLGMILLVLGAVATIVVLVRIISIPEDFAGFGRSIGVWITLVAALTVAVAGFLRGAEDV